MDDNNSSIIPTHQLVAQDRVGIESNSERDMRRTKRSRSENARVWIPETPREKWDLGKESSPPQKQGFGSVRNLGKKS